ncbi:MAG TPA: hypothetical protein VFV67_18670 [Actinophytocola sp.]|uniref:hypothetical protein n=1 Tax=Actinophytocola sp. TaxID=1872138 RepID=UPI002DBCC608|nr:hypothetical protein [Actinophytocola sp.]HEU5472675.1 hypothetical protein [Actinophytocola sp.]
MNRFALFADCLLVGCCTAVAAVPVVTAYPALVAGCAVLRERVLDDRSVGPRHYLRRLGEVVRSGPAGLVLPPLAGLLLGLDALAVAAGVPGRGPLAAGLVLAAAMAAVLGLRIAAGWRPGARWPELLRAAVSRPDPAGAVLLLLAAGTAAAVAIAVPVTLLLVAGPLALAAVAVDLRSVTASRAGSGPGTPAPSGPPGSPRPVPGPG